METMVFTRISNYTKLKCQIVLWKTLYFHFKFNFNQNITSWFISAIILQHFGQNLYFCARDILYAHTISLWKCQFLKNHQLTYLKNNAVKLKCCFSYKTSIWSLKDDILTLISCNSTITVPHNTKVKLFLSLINWAPCHEDVLEGGVGVEINATILELGSRWKWVVRFMLWLLYP